MSVRPEDVERLRRSLAMGPPSDAERLQAVSYLELLVRFLREYQRPPE